MDPMLYEEARTCAVAARIFGLILGEQGMESGGRSLNCWHHSDYGDQFKLQVLLGSTHQEVDVPCCC
jgi:hypothetical protein